MHARRAFFLGLRRVADRALRFGFGIDVAAWAFLVGLKNSARRNISDRFTDSFGGFPARGGHSAEVFDGLCHLRRCFFSLLRGLAFILHDFLRLALFPVRFIFLLAGEDHVFERYFLAVNISADFVGFSEKLFHVCFHFRYPTLYDARFDVVRLGLGVFVAEIFFGWPTT